MKVLTRGVLSPNFDYGDFMYYRKDNSASVIGYNGSGGEVVIPVKASYNGVEEVDVTGIGYRKAFKDNADITSVTGDSITTIGSGEFQNCTNLVTANFPKATNVAEGAFDGCNSLTNYTEGDFTYEVENINNTAKLVKYNGNATEVNIPERIAGKRYAVTTIGNAAFKNNKDIVSVTGDSIKKIEDSAFENCSQHNGTLLTNNTGLNNVNFQNVIFIGSKAFYDDDALINLSFESATYIGDSAFAKCDCMKSLKISNATYIGDNAFEECDDLKSITIDNATYIGSQAFKNASDLDSHLGVIDARSLVYCDIDIFSELAGPITLQNIPKNMKNFDWESRKGKTSEQVTINFSDISIKPAATIDDKSELEDKIEKIKEDLSTKHGGIQIEHENYMENSEGYKAEMGISLKYYPIRFYPKDIDEGIKNNFTDIVFLILVTNFKYNYTTEFVYNGQEQNPTFIIKDGEYTLQQDVDYEIEFDSVELDKNLTDVGEKTATIKFIGAYKDLDNITKTFKIMPKDISGLTVEVEGETEHTYDGKDWNPEFVIKDGETKLEIDKDYIVQFYQNMKDVGTKNVKIKYIGNYTGEKDIQLEITPKNASGFEPNYEQTHVYNGNNWNPWRNQIRN